jgi:hypothetical protein
MVSPQAVPTCHCDKAVDASHRAPHICGESKSAVCVLSVWNRDGVTNFFEATYRREPFVMTREVVALRFNGSFYGIGLSRRYFDSPVVSWGALLVGLVVLGGALAPSSSSTPSSQD